MPITVIVRSAGGNESRLTFDGTQRIVIGRGPGCDVRIPDPSVSHRHATLRGQRADFVLIDEGSSNGTFLGDVRIAPHTSRVVRSGDLARLGRAWIELRIEQAPVTRDVAAATRELALAMLADALDAMGQDATTRVTVVEGADQGAELALVEEGRAYVVGRAAECDLPLADPDTSREHARVIRRGAGVFIVDLGAKNGTWLGAARLPEGRETGWRAAQVVALGRTVLSLREPLQEALARLEQAPDAPMSADEQRAATPPASARVPLAAAPSPAPGPPSAPPPPLPAGPPARARGGWGPVDVAVMAAALGILALSIAGLFWLLRG